MPLRGRVGRHANTGKHCQNWKDDQLAVIALLNKISADKGGAAGGLNGRIVAGIASQPLYDAILRFQKIHHPTNQSGFVEPRGHMLSWMETLAIPTAAPPPRPAPTGQWKGLTTGTVKRAVRQGLDDDMKLDHAEVVNIIRSTLSDGIISQEEVDDLKTVVTTAKSLLPRSKKMLDLLTNKIQAAPGNRGPYDLPLIKHKNAAELACNFLSRSGSGAFSNLDRDEVGVGMLMRIANPGLLNQSAAGLCGPASLLFGLASDMPTKYAIFVTDLFEKGEAEINGWRIKPGGDVRDYAPPASIDPVDWMTMASIRDSENVLWDFDAINDEDGDTTTKEVAEWFKRSGYSDVQKEGGGSSRGVGAIVDVNRLYNQGYRVVLFVNSAMLNAGTQSTKSTKMNHYIVLRAPIETANGTVKAKVFTWGNGFYQIPSGAAPLSVPDFLGNFYGYVAAKP